MQAKLIEQAEVRLVESPCIAGLEFHQQVDIAHARLVVGAHDRTESMQARHTMAAAGFGDCLALLWGECDSHDFIVACLHRGQHVQHPLQLVDDGLLHLDAPGFDPGSERLWHILMAQLWAAADLRAELVELFELLLERTDHLVAPLTWPFLAAGEPAPPVPLGLHGRYSRAEVFAAFGLLNDARTFPGREGVFFDEATRCDVFFITLKKSERLFSPTTRYNDYAISPWEFHWESQSLTREASATGQRYIHHRERGSRVLLFVREENKRGGVTLPFHCLGFADYVSHEGERPMAIRWRLQRAIPAAFYPELAVAV